MHLKPSTSSLFSEQSATSSWKMVPKGLVSAVKKLWDVFTYDKVVSVIEVGLIASMMYYFFQLFKSTMGHGAKFDQNAIINKMSDVFALRRSRGANEQKENELKQKDISLATKLYKQLSHHQTACMSFLVAPSTTGITLDDIGGLEQVKREVKDKVIFPLRNPNFFDNPKSLLQPIRGILLEGPPGTGKTMIAKAIANECKCSFLNVKRELLQHSLLGESEKAMAALFQVARAMQPSIIFIDEIDTLFRSRSESMHEVSSRVLGIVLSQIEGLETNNSERITVIAATNHSSSLDPAISRRLPLKLHVPLPNEVERLDILKKLLKEEKFDFSKVDFDKIVSSTNQFSGADLKELCKMALHNPIVESTDQKTELRPLRTEDFTSNVNSIKPINKELQQEQMLRNFWNSVNK
ncbi:ATPase family AAA domain-containing protein [Acrasis kona]|uniref:ATPase family AAA domain-containing protein n=1 Tax=Acrasis kona TaxID=1008807 RepID=A0AAW2YX37_9EUKA